MSGNVNVESLPTLTGTAAEGLILVGVSVNSEGTPTSSYGVSVGEIVTIVGNGAVGPTPTISADVTGLTFGSEPYVTITGTTLNPVFTFGIPAGEPGSPGSPGNPGSPGSPGAPGATPVISATVSGLPYGDNPTVNLGGTSLAPIFEFALPSGPPGSGGGEAISSLSIAPSIALTDYLGGEVAGLDARINVATLISNASIVTTPVLNAATASLAAQITINSNSIVTASSSIAAVSSLANSNAASISNEATLRANGDATLSTALASEIASRQAVESALTVGLSYVAGGYNAATNTPALVAGAANGTAYTVSVAGTPPGTVPCGQPGGEWGPLIVGQTIYTNGTVWFAQPTNFAPLQNPSFSGQSTFGGAVTISTAPGSDAVDFVDPGGFLLLNLGPDGSIYSQGTEALIGGMSISSGTGYNGLIIDDPGGFVGLAIPFGNITSTPTFSTDDYLSSDIAALSTSLLIESQNNITGQRPTAQLNGLPGFGQSEQQGDQDGYSQSTVAVAGNMMLGTDTRPLSQNGTVWLPVGGNTLTPLISVNQDPVSGLVKNPIQGGFLNIVGTITVSDSPNSSMTFTSCSGTLVTELNNLQTFTAVGGAGQPSFDLTGVLTVGDLHQYSGFSGSTAYINNGGVSDMSRQIGTLTPNSITLTSGSSGYAVDGTSNGPISIYRTNNGGAFGEDPNVSTANDLSQLSALDSATGTPQNFWVINGAIAGQSVAQLSKGNAIYSRFISGIMQLQALKSPLGPNPSLVNCFALIFRQGNGDIVPTPTSQATYIAELTTLITNFRSDMMAIFGQTSPPFWFMDQIAGPQLSNSDALNDAVVMAQLLMALSPPNPDFYLIGPTYYRPNTGVHPTPNGQRQTGAMARKVIKRVLAGKGWLPMYPVSINYRGYTIRISVHAPVPPIQFRPAYHLCQPRMTADAGFLITDANGVNPILTVTIVGSVTLAIQCARLLVGPVTVQYADGATHNGLGNLFDSDGALTPQVYEYQAFAGYMPVENIGPYTDTSGLTGTPGLTFPSPIGEQMPLNNGLCVFNMQATAV